MVRQMYFCIGAAKTGTTILARLLDQQPGVACIWEGYLLRPNHRSSILNPDGKAWARHGFRGEQIRAWHDRAVAPVDLAGRQVMAMRHPGHVRSVVGEVLEAFGEMTSASVVGDKWPDYYRNLGLMMRAFPDAKFLYNVRDPRAVWNSGQTFRDREAGDRVLATMLDVDATVRPHLDDERVMTLRYEDLITDAEQTIAAVAEFLGFEFDPGAIPYDAAGDPFPNRWYWIPEATGNLDVRLTEKWRDEMPGDKQVEVARMCADFLSRYRYDASPPGGVDVSG
jgi:hypothetical protein